MLLTTYSFMAYKPFVVHCFCPGETAYVYLTELWKLSVSFSGMTEHGLICAFVTGLADHVKQLLASSQMADNSITLLLAQARVILNDDHLEARLNMAAVCDQCMTWLY